MSSPARKAFLFDLDGTLVDTLGDLASAVNAMLRIHGFPQHRTAAYARMVGDGFSALVRRALPETRAFSEAELSLCRSQALDEYATCSLDTTAPYPGILQSLAGLSKVGATLCVLSNKPDSLVQPIVKALFPGRLFAIVQGEREGLPRKPDPEAAIGIARAIGIDSSLWAFVGDSDTDMLAAKRSGMLPVGVSWGYRSRRELADAGAVEVLDTPFELLRFAALPSASD